MAFLNTKRDASKVYQHLELKGDSVIAKGPLKLYIPVRYTTRGLGNFSDEIDFLGIFTIVTPDGYSAVSSLNAMVKSEPTLITKLTVDDVEYHELHYTQGAKVIVSTTLRKIDSLLYRIHDELQAKGRMPGYLDYNDQCDLFYTSGYHAGPTVGANIAVQEMIAATIAKNPENYREPYRMYLKDLKQIETNPPVVIGLRAVGFGSDSAVAKLMGQYFDANMTSVLKAPGEKVGRIERLLRT